jgi:hypothetical protein
MKRGDQLCHHGLQNTNSSVFVPASGFFEEMPIGADGHLFGAIAQQRRISYQQ